MNFCQAHWDGLKAEVIAQGLGDFIKSSGEELMRETVMPDLEGKKPNLKSEDPLLACSLMIFGRVMENVGIGMMAHDPETGRPYCPCCVAEKEGVNIETWFKGCVEAEKKFLSEMKGS